MGWGCALKLELPGWILYTIPVLFAVFSFSVGFVQAGRVCPALVGFAGRLSSPSSMMGWAGESGFPLSGFESQDSSYLSLGVRISLIWA